MFTYLKRLLTKKTTTDNASPEQLTDALPMPDTPMPVAVTSEGKYVYLDTETTGLNYEGLDEVLEIAIVGEVGETLMNTLVKPVHHTVWPHAQQIHGITPDDVADAPTWEALLPKIAATCKDKTVVIYNAPFDTSFFPDNFFPSVECAMRCYANVNPGGGSWTKLEIAAANTGFVSEGKFHRALADTLACRHIWQIGIPELEKKYPAVIKPVATTTSNHEPGDYEDLVFYELSAAHFRYLTAGDRFQFWTKPDMDFIRVYNLETFAKSGSIAVLEKAKNPRLAAALDGDQRIELLLTERNCDRFSFKVHKVPARGESGLQNYGENFSTPLEYSEIDEDIYRCFIANKTGMCDAIGTWDAFHEIEASIAQICKMLQGRYYKSPAKGVKFAIVFSPSGRYQANIQKLRESGYKVTTFEKAVAHFGLGHKWDCDRHATYAEEVRQYMASYPQWKSH